MKTIPVKSIQLQGHQTNGFDGFKIRSISEVIAGKDMNQDLHRHDFYFILVARKGAGLHAIDFVEHKVTANAIFMLRPGQVHKLQLKAGSEGYLLEFSKDFQFLSKTGNELLRKATNRNYCQLDKMGTGALCAILQTMLEEFRARQEGFENVIKANLEVFFIQYLRYRQQDQGTDNNKANHYQQEKLQEFLDLLEVNINSEKHASAYADMVSLSPFQLNSITKNLLGKTVAELIEDQILLEAKRYLLATSNQVNQIAFQLGYEDVSYFIRFFKKLTGHTPEAFRKNFR
jgi:AraC family transcriptional regulator, transcriptional activator of pobA